MQLWGSGNDRVGEMGFGSARRREQSGEATAKEMLQENRALQAQVVSLQR